MFRSILSIGAVALALSALGSCATLSRDECQIGDWYGVGYSDGVAGHPETRLERHREACAKHGVAVEFEPYQDGRDQGLLVYCQPERGFEEGIRGRTYHGVCPPDLATPFVLAYQDGRLIYELRDTVDDIENEIERLESRVYDIEDEIRDIEDRLDDGGLSQNKRRDLRDEIRDLRRERRDCEDQIRDLERDRVDAILDLERAEAELGL